MWNTRDFVRGTGFIRLKREFQLGVNGRYEISGGLKRNALSTAIRITRIGLADIPVVLPFLKKKKKKEESFSNAPSPPRSAPSHPIIPPCGIKGVYAIPATSAPVQSPVTHASESANRFAKWSSSGINPGIFDRCRDILFSLRSFQNCTNLTITFCYLW